MLRLGAVHQRLTSAFYCVMFAGSMFVFGGQAFGSEVPGCDQAGDQAFCSFGLKSAHSNRCLDVMNASMWPGTGLIQYGCVNGQANQTFTLHPTGDGYYSVVVMHSGMCLDVPEGSSTRGVGMIQWPCDGSANQQFNFNVLDNGDYEIISRRSGLCVDIGGAGTQDYVAAIQFKCSHQDNQAFKLKLVAK